MVYSLATDNSNFQLTVFDSLREEEKTGKKKKRKQKKNVFQLYRLSVPNCLFFEFLAEEDDFVKLQKKKKNCV